ncbi:MAG: ATP-binding cassette domain-containing protein, partial [Lachnospiraceae bacterium]|nr:ATP-binding cassette domain-containing protein [Lachnospiraceae bacterium]
HFGTNVQIGYFDQQMAMYSGSKTVLDDFWDEFPNLTETEARSALGAFLFSGDDVFKNIDMLSGGEKVRLALCKILKRKPNVLILDEPTNHMDIVGKETLESMLCDFSGTLIFVSHDRYFVRKVSNRLLVFEDGTTHLYQFGYEEYQEKLEREVAESEENERKQSPVFGGAISQNGQQRENSGRKEYYNPGKERSRLEKKIKKAEEELAAKEERLEELKAELLLPQYQSSYSKLTEIQEQIDALEEEILEDMNVWESLSQELEKL